MAQIRRPATFFPMALKSLLFTMLVIWSCWWCTTGNRYRPLEMNSLQASPSLCFKFHFPDETVFFAIQDILCWDCSQHLNKKEKGYCWESCTVGYLCYEQAGQVAEPRRWMILLWQLIMVMIMICMREIFCSGSYVRHYMFIFNLVQLNCVGSLENFVLMRSSILNLQMFSISISYLFPMSPAFWLCW